MAQYYPRTPSQRTGKGLDLIIEDLNLRFDVRIPNPSVSSPSTREKELSLDIRCFKALKELYFRNVHIHRILEAFEETVRIKTTQWLAKPRQEPGTIPTRNDFLRRDGYRSISHDERLKRLQILLDLLDEEIYLVRGGSFSEQALERPRQPRDLTNGPPRASDHASSRAPVQTETKRKSFEDEEVFLTAPSSPILPSDEGYPPLKIYDEFEDSAFDAMNITDDCILDEHQKPEPAKKSKKRQSRIFDYMNVVKPDQSLSNNKAQVASHLESEPSTSFATTVVSSIFDSRSDRVLGRSFDTDITEPVEEDETRASSTVGLMLSEEVTNLLQSAEAGSLPSSKAPPEQDIAEQKLLKDLLENGPFAKRETFPRSVSLRSRYELERITQEWRIPPAQVLAGDRVPFNNHEDFWKWIEGHTQRHGEALPEKSSAKAWDAAVNLFKVADKHSEVVVFTGILNWCDHSEAGIFKLKLNPLRIERGCRFHRRFGSDRFLSLTIPAPSRPPNHLRFYSRPSFLRESVAKWLTGYEHYLLGRRWRAFYVEEVKTKGKKRRGEPRFRVDFFAVDGSDFDHRSPSQLAAMNQPCDKHTPMSVEALLNWHIPRTANMDQTDCKLFQRIALGLSKTWATVVLRPKEIIHLKDERKPVMNDGCALMSRALAREICDSLGISENTPSCFQGRIAGAKGLWMVDRHNSPIEAGDRDFWIQISDSQLKVKPHPRYWSEECTDDEQLTFEVSNWSKSLHPVELNTQLLNILEQGGPVREYVAEVMRNGIRQSYQDFAAVIEKDSILLARALVQKLRPRPQDGLSRHSLRKIDHWVLDNTDCIIRLLEAGFSPRNFRPLRDRLRRLLTDTLDRYVNELHIPIPLSTYAYCIADPYGVLAANEVHLGFSNRWKSVEFEDIKLNEVDVLVGRLPAHRPSDIQRRRAVWKEELSHFMDVIVFPSRGDEPLAHLLSGGDYDGDTPWICWDQGIVESFENSRPPREEDHPPEEFGLTRHARPMSAVQSTQNFLEKTFMFNLTLSNLGRCTVEHEKLVYDEPESVNSQKAQELATLLSHLVDGRKGGLQLSEKAWIQYRKKISPRKREVPAYKDNNASHWKASSIIDFLKFDVATKEREDALVRFATLCKGLNAEDGRDPDLLRPWNTVFLRAEKEKEDFNQKLSDAIEEVRQQVEQAYTRWTRFCRETNRPFESIVQRAADLLREIQPPNFDHPLGHTWQNSEFEWQRLVASCIYNKYRWSNFAWYAVGETLCRIKTGNAPARLVCDIIYHSLKVNSKVSRRLAAMEVGDDDEDDAAVSHGDEEFEGKEAIEFLSRDDAEFATLDYFDDDEDGLSVE